MSPHTLLSQIDTIEEEKEPRLRRRLERALVEAIAALEPSAGEGVVEQLIPRAEAVGLQALAADLRMSLGRCRAARGVHDVASYTTAYEGYIEGGLLDRAAAAALAAGDAEAASRRYRGALAWYTSVLDLGVQAADRMITAAGLEHLGELYTTLRDYAKALDYYLQSLSIYDEQGDLTRLPHVLHAIGLVHGFNGDYDAAYDYLAKSLEAFRESGDHYLEVKALKNIGDIHCARGHFDLALDCGMRALAVYEALGDRSGTVSALLTLGTIHARRRQIDVALHVHRRALEYLGESDEKELHLTTLLNIGRLYRETGDHKGARFVLEQGLAIAEALDDRTVQYQIHEELSRALEKLGDHRGALDHHRAFVKIYQEATGEEKQRSIAEVQMRFDLERALKDEEIRQRNNVMRAVVATQEEERRRIAGDLHDGLGQLLATAKINLLRIEDAVRDLGADQQDAFFKAMSILDSACADVRSLAHTMASATLQELGIEAALADMVAMMQSSGSVAITLDVHGAEHRLPEYVELGLYRIAQELINNIIKHASAAEATIQLIRFEENVVLMVHDNGIGFDAAHLAQGGATGGMGLRNIQTRVKLLNGSVEFDSRIGHGTTVTIEIPIPLDNGEAHP